MRCENVIVLKSGAIMSQYDLVNRHYDGRVLGDIILVDDTRYLNMNRRGGENPVYLLRDCRVCG